MSARTHQTRRPAPDPRTLLTALATGIDGAFAGHTVDHPAQLLRVVSCPDAPQGIELGLLPLEPGEHPADAVAGFTAPLEWQAVGLVTSGLGYELERDARPADRIRLTFLLDRSGTTVTLLTPLDAPTPRRTLHEPPDGLIADACRRVLGLPTSPPAEGLEPWLAARWLDRLLSVSVAEPGAIATWDDAVAVHPLVSAGSVPSATALVELVDEAASQFDWDRLRLLSVHGRSPHPTVAPGIAAWMDAGCFARYLLAAELPVGLLMRELEALLPKELARSVRSTLPAPWRAPP